MVIISGLEFSFRGSVVDALTVVSPDEINPDDEDFVRNYSLCLIRYYLFCDLKDVTKEGNGQRLACLHKALLLHFKALPGFNAYAIEMLINTVQHEVFLSEAEAHQCK